MGRPQQHPQAGSQPAQAGLKVVDSAKAESSGKPAQSTPTAGAKAPEQDAAAARKRLHPARVWPD
jgi:hypothetical protein